MRRRDAVWLGAICLCEMARMLVFLNYTAVLPILQADWEMRHAEAGLIFSAYQACYLVAVLVLATLTDRMDTRTIYVTSAVWAGLAALAFPFFAQGFLSAAILRALAGIGLAGTYVPGMRMVAQRFSSENRGVAIACYASAFGVGSAASLFAAGQLASLSGWRLAMGATAGAARPPLVYAGANQPKMLHATAPGADGVMYSDMPRARIAETVRQTRQALVDKNGPAEGYRISNIWAWHIKADRAVALREARRELLLRGLLERWYLETFLSAEDCDFIEKHKMAFFKAYRERSGVIEGVPERLVNDCLANLTFTGTPDEIESHIGELRAFRAAGVDELCLRLHDDPADAIRLIGEHLLPLLRE